MSKIFIVVEKWVAVLFSQRMAATLAILIVGVVLLANMIMPLVSEAFSEIAVPEQDQLAEAIAQWLAQASVAITFLLGVFKTIGGMVSSIQDAPPTLMADWYERRN